RLELGCVHERQDKQNLINGDPKYTSNPWHHLASLASREELRRDTQGGPRREFACVAKPAAYTRLFMRKPVDPGSEAAAITGVEQVRAGTPTLGATRTGDYDADLIALRDQIADEKPEDLPSLVEQMTRVQALASGRRRAVAPVDPANPYFAHLGLQAEGRPRI